MIFFLNPVDRIYQYLLIAAFFFLPLTVLANNLAIWLIAIIWFATGDYEAKFKSILANKLSLASIAFYLIHLISLLWTEDYLWGLEILRKMLPFITILPIFLTLTYKENLKYYVGAFLSAIFISVCLSYSVWLGFIEPFGHATVSNPTPIVSHISYNPFLAFAFYLVVNHLLSSATLSQVWRILYTFFSFTICINMFITGGRAGQVMFFVALILLVFQHFRRSQIRASIISLSLVVAISFTAYQTSPIFKERVDSVADNIVNYESNRNTAVGQRITFLVNSFELFKRSPVIGVGVGDYPSEYEVVSNKNTPEVDLTSQPHNMYMLIMSQLGLVGLMSFFSIFYYQFRIALRSNYEFVKNVGVAMPILFLTIMWSDSYLLGHFTGNLFILFSALIYSEN